jgi:hypothetical protein
MKEAYQFKITLKNSKPPIWRRVLVPTDITFTEFHNIIQDVMGWGDCHLWEFHIADYRIGKISDENDSFGWDEDDDKEDSDTKTISEFINGEKKKIKYWYDFGDDWWHDVVFEKTLEVADDSQLPFCVKGALNCPPEDCGGIWGYYQILAILSNPAHEEYEEMLEWIGEDFNPEEFDIDEINETLRF